MFFEGGNVMGENEFHGYIGTYTKADSKGIYKFILDTRIGEIKEIKLAASYRKSDICNN